MTDTLLPKNDEELRSWWFETNGTGTESCPKCIQSENIVCTWHVARLNDLAELIQARDTKMLEHVIGDDPFYVMHHREQRERAKQWLGASK